MNGEEIHLKRSSGELKPDSGNPFWGDIREEKSPTKEPILKKTSASLNVRRKDGKKQNNHRGKRETRRRGKPEAVLSSRLGKIPRQTQGGKREN